MGKHQKIITVRANNMNISQETKKILTKKLEGAGFKVSDRLENNTSLVISIGGDGSFLKTARDLKFPPVPILGINTGHLGFFAEIKPEEIDSFIENYKKNKYFLQDIYLLKATICTKDSCIDRYVINEVVIKGDRSRTIHFKMSLNDDFIENFSGDGMIICTSTGSTAYNYSSGGSIVDNSLQLMQITPLSPISTSAYRSFTSSILVPGNNSTIKITPEYRFENSMLIVTDGVEHRFRHIETIKFQMSRKKIKLLRMPSYKFWKRVSDKFLINSPEK